MTQGWKAWQALASALATRMMPVLLLPIAAVLLASRQLHRMQLLVGCWLLPK
jgi:hypothetical protein